MDGVFDITDDAALDKVIIETLMNQGYGRSAAEGQVSEITRIILRKGFQLGQNNFYDD